MKIKNILFVPLFLLLSFSLAGCVALQNLTPGALIPDLTEADIEPFMLEVLANMDADEKFKTTIESEGSEINVLVDGENSMLSGTTTEGELQTYTVDGFYYIYSDGTWIKYSASIVDDQSNPSFDEYLFREEIQNMTYVGKEECPEAQGTCYLFNIDEEDSTGKLFVNAVTKLPVTYEHMSGGKTTLVTYDFEISEGVVLPEGAEDAVSL